MAYSRYTIPNGGGGFYASQSNYKQDILDRANDIISLRNSKTEDEENKEPEASSSESGGWEWLNTPTDETSIQTNTEVSPQLKERQKTAMSYLTSKGYSKEAAAGIVGVLTAESNLTPGITNKEEERDLGGKAGKGIAQWSNERRAAYDKAMQGKQGLEAELDFLLSELDLRPAAKTALMNAKSVEDAVKAMHLGYENGTASALATPE